MYAEIQPPVEVHDPDEIDRAISALSDADLNRLRTAARVWIRVSGLDAVAADADDLVSEAIFRTVSGHRSWRVGVDFVHHLRIVTKSILDSWRKSAARRAAAGAAEVRETELPETEVDPSVEEAEPSSPLLDAPSPEPGVERVIVGQQDWRAWEARFAGDEGASAVLSGIFYEMTGPQVQERFGMTEKQYRAAVRRVRRCADRQGGGRGR